MRLLETSTPRRRYLNCVSTIVGRLAASTLAGIGEAFGDGAPGSELARNFRTHIDCVVAALLRPHLRQEIMLWRHANSMGGWALLAARDGAPEDDEAALDHMESGGWSALFDRLPLLQPLLTTVVAGEVAAAQSFAADLHQDLPLLSEVFCAGSRIDPVAVQPGLSDPHQGRRSVCSVHFSNGRQLIYKPRPVGMERGLAEMLTWLAARGAPLVSYAPLVCDRGDHGWMEHVAFEPCETAADADLYYQRLGALSCLLACLGAVDCHADNFIARGARPVLIDAETLLHPRLAASPDFTLMETEIFPRLIVTPSGQTVVYGGFDKEYAALGEAVETAAHAGRQSNQPHLAGMAVPLSAHRAATAIGVAAMADWLDRHASAFLADDGPARTLLHNKTRVILRPTSMYAAVLAASLQEAMLRDVSSRATPFARLRRHDDRIVTPDAWEAIHHAEVASLSAVDIPYFLLDPKSGDVMSEDRVVARGVFAPAADRLGSGFEAALRACREVADNVADSWRAPR